MARCSIVTPYEDMYQVKNRLDKLEYIVNSKCSEFYVPDLYDRLEVNDEYIGNNMISSSDTMSTLILLGIFCIQAVAL